MQSKKITRLTSGGALSLILASSCLTIFVGLAGQDAHAAGLGKLTVLSSLGQPLRAEIELTSVTKNDVGNLYPKLANAEEFRHANVDYNAALSSLRFIVEDRGSRHFVLITSSQSINEPYVEILVELSSSSGRLIREYAMLLDVVGVNTNRAAASTENEAPAKRPVTTMVAKEPISPIKSKSIETKQSAKLSAKPSDLSDSNQHASYYQIKSGDTLGKIAEQMNYPGISLDQMLVALQRSNPSALIHNNMNLIRTGVILTIPDINEVKRIDQAEAEKIVLAQAIDFNAYREKLANYVAQSQSEKTTISKKINSGKITAKVTETPTPINESKDKLQLSKIEVDSGIQEEEKIAQQKTLELANERVKELEKNTANLQKILELQNETAAAASQKQTTNTDVSNPAALPVIEAKPNIVVAAKSKKTPSFFENWERYLPYGAILIALLSVVGIYASKRKKKIEHRDDEVQATPMEMKVDPQKTDKSAATPTPTPMEFDLSGIDLDLPKLSPATISVQMATKLDLALAYQKIGDKEGARELLSEVLQSGAGEQAERAKAMLHELT